MIALCQEEGNKSMLPVTKKSTGQMHKLLRTANVAS